MADRIAQIMNTSVMSQITNLGNMGADAVKAIRANIKGLGGDARFFCGNVQAG